MRTVVHLSDLHFGRVDDALLRPLQDLIVRLDPQLVVVSGDLTQRARTAEFIAAREFLDTLPKPQIVVPGNHDVSLHNLFNRFVRPLDKYRQIVTKDLAPQYIDDEIAVFGINTARSLTFKNGRIATAELSRLRAQLAELPLPRIKIIVTHHPFDLPEQLNHHELAGRAPAAMALFADTGADVLLAGHLHASHAGSSAARYPVADYAALVVQAGTATSTRGRGESNSFNVLRIDSAVIAVERYHWLAASEQGPGNFALAATEHFVRLGKVWQER
jgi:3',5'-cyclic AMP phosphodiesterase CpdA